ncbi:hypothetical protein ABZX92_45475, partial [Lentzea sp. NPDC006480]|uniref:hypothetical protein n=1 Tax=Lentzea sp. NPDC006480 TaxID=3157176 RepID=UPI0033BEF36B
VDDALFLGVRDEVVDQHAFVRQRNSHLVTTYATRGNRTHPDPAPRPSTQADPTIPVRRTPDEGGHVPGRRRRARNRVRNLTYAI